jgi:hypothetical protein
MNLGCLSQNDQHQSLRKKQQNTNYFQETFQVHMNQVTVKGNESTRHSFEKTE